MKLPTLQISLISNYPLVILHSIRAFTVVPLLTKYIAIVQHIQHNECFSVL